MSTNSGLEIKIKKFYDKNGFPGRYSAGDVAKYYNANRYLTFINRYISGSLNVLDAGCGTGFIVNHFATKNKDVKFTGVDFAKSVIWAEKIRKEFFFFYL